MCRLYGIVCVLCKTRLIFPRINGPNNDFDFHNAEHKELPVIKSLPMKEVETEMIVNN